MSHRTPTTGQRIRVAAAATVAAALLAGCGKPPKPPTPPQGTPQVSYVVIQPQRLPLTTELPGRATPVLVADVRPQVSGLLRARLFKEGADVKAGQVLYQIDAATYSASVDSARAAVARADAQVGTSKLKAQRTAELAAIKAVSQQDADDAAAALKQAEADAQSGRAQLQTARIDLDRTRVTSPISGRIGRSAVTPGALVTASQATALATVQKLDPIYIDFTQSSNIVLLLKRLMAEGRVQPGAAKVKLLLDDGTVYPHEGRLQFTEVGVDSGTGSVTLRAEFPNPTAGLLPGMYVRGVIEAGVVEQALLVPQQSITRDPAGGGIGYVIGADNKLEPRQIVTRRAIGDKWLVSDGVRPGDKLAVTGQDKVKPGVAVQAVPYNPNAQPAAASGAGGASGAAGGSAPGKPANS